MADEPKKVETHYSMDDGVQWAQLVTQNIHTALMVLSHKKPDDISKRLANRLLEKSLRELNNINPIPNV